MDKSALYVLGLLISVGGFSLAFARARFTLGQKIGELEQWKNQVDKINHVPWETYRDNLIRIEKEIENRHQQSQRAIIELRESINQRHSELLFELREQKRSLISSINDRDGKLVEIIQLFTAALHNGTPPNIDKR